MGPKNPYLELNLADMHMYAHTREMSVVGVAGEKTAVEQSAER